MSVAPVLLAQADAAGAAAVTLARLILVVPEMVLLTGAVVATILGLSRSRALRDATPAAVVISLLAAMLLVPLVHTPERAEAAGLLMPMLGKPVRMAICAIGAMLCLVSIGLVDRRIEAAFASGRAAFDPIRVIRGEYYAFFLLSVTGLMLVSTANDLIWLFLALELTSLPTYIMVAISRPSRRALEAAVKYFFLGALATATFLYGFAMLYGAAGTLILTEMRDVFAAQAAAGGLGILAVLGLILAILGVAYKIAAAPMHFYAADVYEGAASPVTAFLAFVPKAAGMLALMLLLGTVGWHGHSVVDDSGARIFHDGLPRAVLYALWIIAAMTMTLGNVGALLQSSAKRMLAYSSIAHSGYMIIGLIAGPGLGLNSVLFYLLAYGVMNTAAFAILAGLERQGEEIESLADLAGLARRHPLLAAAMAISAGSLIGLPPLLGFWGKLYLFIGGIQAGQIGLVIIACINSAISAWYYLRLVGLPLLSPPTPQAEAVVPTPSIWPRVAALSGAAAILLLPLLVQPLVEAAQGATSATPADFAVVLRGAGAPAP
ncbi:MAG TPA: NADH-quinone oxidoreductase subunit N [Phycisphaerales bacterium]|nr:NADH-quinone oxidoreductase subunit N [Phycisphaerales bacterium]HMP36856.1 NADH-quinone oxidoreductase subunit N [Phycisphaerales bacterium]